jgi:hypothetical protein
MLEGRFLSLAHRGIGAIFIVLGAAPIGLAQRVSVGIKAGVPCSDVVAVARDDSVSPYYSQTKPYTLGPVVDVRLVWGLRVEIGAMYKRIDQQVGRRTYIFTDDDGNVIGGGTRPAVAAAGQSWVIPMAGQYSFGHARERPYVEGGFAYNHLSNVFVGRPASTSYFNSSYSPLLPASTTSVDRTGFLLGAGVEINLPMLRLSPGVRYTRYRRDVYWLPSPYAVDALLGITWKAKRSK